MEHCHVKEQKILDFLQCFKRFNKFRTIFTEKPLKFLKTKVFEVFERLSIFNESIIMYGKTQKVKQKCNISLYYAL